MKMSNPDHRGVAWFLGGTSGLRVRAKPQRVKQPVARKVGKVPVVDEWPRRGPPKAVRPKATTRNPVGQFDNFSIFC